MLVWLGFMGVSGRVFVFSAFYFGLLLQSCLSLLFQKGGRGVRPRPFKSNYMKHFVTVRIVLFSKARKNGTKTVCLRVTQQRKVKYFFLGRNCLPGQWDESAGRFAKSYPDHKAENDMLRTYEQRASDAIRSMERDGVPFSFERIESAVFGESSAGGATLVAAWLRTIRDELVARQRYGNSRFYHSTANALESFRPKATLSDVDKSFLTKFERWLETARDTNSGGASIYLRTIRAACNRAIADGVMPRSWYPFELFSLAHLTKGKAKRSAPLDFFRALEQLCGNSEQLTRLQALSVDLFLFSFYLRGMNLADIAELTEQSLYNGRIIYTRKKTGREYSVRVNDRALAIWAKYATGGGGPVFPVYLSASLTDKQKHTRRVKVSRQLNTALREVAALIGWNVPDLSFYTARHSYADGLKKAGVSVDVISEALGHADVRTTDSYLKGFGEEVVDKADDLLL